MNSVTCHRYLFLMKKTVLSICALMAALSSFAQVEINLNVHHLFNGEEYVENSEFTSLDGYPVEFGRMEYYLSNFVITHDGGQSTELTDTYVLVDAHDDVTYPLGSWEIYSLEGISFSVGVDEFNNHEDPAAWPSDHPLAPQLPSMHWGWASGYRFIAYEGNSGGNGVEIHALGDDNYFEQSHELAVEALSGGATIDLFADYAPMLNGIDVSNGLIEHSPVNEAVDLLENFRDLVFSTDGATGVEEGEKLSMRMAPNPASDVVSIQTVGEGDLLIRDLAGRVFFQDKAGLRTDLTVADWPSGIYLVQVTGATGEMLTRRLVIQ